MAGFDLDKILGKPISTPFLKVQTARDTNRTSPYRGDFFSDDTQRGGTSSNLEGGVNPQFQTTGAIAGRRLGDVAENAEFLMDSLGPNATEEEKEQMRRIIAAGGFDPEEPGWLSKAFKGLIGVIDLPRKLVSAGVADVFNIGEEFSFAQANRQIWDDAIGLGDLIKPPSKPEDVKGLDQWRTEDGEFWVTGSQMLRALGWDTEEEEGNSLFNKIARGTVGFGIDFALDPLSWVSFGALGLGKNLSTAGARAGMASAVRKASDHLIANTWDEVADPLTRHMGDLLQTEGRLARDEAFKLAEQAELRRRGVKKLRSADRTSLRQKTDDIWYRHQAQEAELRAAGTKSTDAMPLAADMDAYGAEFVELITKKQRSPLANYFDKIDQLVAEKKYRTLEDWFPEFIKSDLVPAHSKGGLTITTPFMRKKMGGVNLGLRTDRELTKPIREAAEWLWNQMPYDGMRGALEATWARRGVEIAGGAFRRTSGAWSAEGVQGRAAHAVKMLGVTDAPGNLDVAVRQVARVAEAQGLDQQEMFTNLTRMLDEGWSPSFLQNQVPDEVMRETLEAAYLQTREVLGTLHRAMKAVGVDIGEIEDYFPMIASKEFVKLLKTLSEDAVPDPILRLIDRAVKEGTKSGLNADQVNGLIIFDQFLTKMRRETAEVAGNVSAVDRTAHQSKRLVGETAFSDLGGVDMAVMKKSQLRKLLVGTKGGWSSRVDMNRAVAAAIDLIQDAGGFGKRNLQSFDALSMDLPAVLDSYVKAISRVVHMKTLIAEGKRAAMIGLNDKILDVGATLHEIAVGPLRPEHRATLQAIAEWVSGVGHMGSPQMRRVEVVSGWLVDLPEELAGDVRVIEAFKELQVHATKAVARAGEHVEAMESEVRNLVAQGVYEPIARDVAFHTSDKHLVEAQAALFAALSDEVATLRANAVALTGGMTPEQSRLALQAADEMAQEWMSMANRTLEDLTEQWRQRLGYERWSDDGVIDLLAPNADGVAPFAPLVGKMEQEVNRLVAKRINQIIDVNLRAEITAAATTGDMRLSIARALKNDVESNIIPNAVNEAWNDIANAVRMSQLTFDDVRREVGSVKAVEVVRKLTGFVEPDTIISDLREVAEEFAEKFGRPYLPRVIDEVGEVKAISREYLSMPSYTVADAGVFEQMQAETISMYHALRDAGYEIVPGGTGRLPYATFGDRLRDVAQNRRLVVSTAPNPSEAKMFNEMVDGIPFGNLFDAVHVIFGHAIHGFDDSIEGVTQAWLAHGQLYSDGARDAFSSLTRGRRVAVRAVPDDVTYVARRMSLLPSEITALDMTEWQPKIAFAKLAQKEDFKQAAKLAKNLEERARRMSELESQAIVAYKLQPKRKPVKPKGRRPSKRDPRSGVANVADEGPQGGRPEFAINLDDQRNKALIPDPESGAIVVRFKNGRTKTFESQKELDAWQKKHRMQLRTEAEQLTDAERRLRKDAVAMRPRPARKYDINKLPPAERERRLEADLAALKQYQKEVRLYANAVKSVTPEARAAAEEELKAGWALVKDTKQLIENGVMRREKALGRKLTPKELTKAREEIGAAAPLAPTKGYKDWVDLNRNSSSVDDILGTRKPLPPDLHILQDDDLAGFPLYGSTEEYFAWEWDVTGVYGDEAFLADRAAADAASEVLISKADEGGVYGLDNIEDPFDYYKTLDQQFADEVPTGKPPSKKWSDKQYQGELEPRPDKPVTVVDAKLRGRMASTNLKEGTVRIDRKAIRLDYNEGMPYLLGEKGPTSAQKAQALRDLGVEPAELAEWIKVNGGADMYERFVEAHEKAHALLHRGRSVKRDVMAESNMVMEREAHEKALNQVGYWGSKAQAGRPAQVEITTAGGQVVLRNARDKEQAAKIMAAYMENLKDRWHVMDEQLELLHGKLADEMAGVDLADLVGRQPVGLKGQGFSHEVFTDEGVQGMAAAAHKKLGAADGRQAARDSLDRTRRQAEILSESRSLRGLYDGKYLAPDTNLMSEMRRALIDGDATYLANHEEDFRELLKLIGFDPKKFVFEPRADGTYGMKYLTGELQWVDPIPPESLRDELADWVPFNVRKMSTEEIVVKTNQLIEEGVLRYERFSPEVEQFLRRVPDGKLPVEYEAIDYLRHLVPELELAQGNLRRQLKHVGTTEADDAAESLNDLLDMVEPFLRRRVGDEDGLLALWDAKRKLLEKVLPEDAYKKIEGLVSVAPVVRKATAKARSGLGKNAGRKWGKASELYDAFENTKREAIEILYKPGNDRADAAAILKSIEDLQDTLLSVEPAFARGTKGSGSVDIGFEPSYRQAVSTDSDEAVRLMKAVETLNEQQRVVAQSVNKVSTDKSLQAHVLRVLEEQVPDVAAGLDPDSLDKWIRGVGEKLLNPNRPVVRETTSRRGSVSPSVMGIGGEDLKDMQVDVALARILENMASHIQASFTPIGIKVMADQVRGFERYWKGAVTVGRPTFVLRNLLGGTFNNSIIDVGAREYFWLRNKALILRKDLQNGVSWEDALKKLSPEDADVFQRAREMRIFDAEFSSDIADPLLGRAAKTSYNPAAGMMGGDKTFVGFDWGGRFMQSSEDWLRMAAFKRWYDPNNPQSALFAREMVFAVHFDYASLSRLESKIKRFVPFFVWTRRNIPLQVQQLMENPGFYNKYMSLQRNVKTTFEDDEYTFADRNPIPGWMGSGTADLDTVTDQGDGLWTRWMFDPDLPTRDLEQLVDRFSGGNPFSNAMGFAKDMLSPALSLPADIAGSDDFFANKKITAPTGLAGILKALDSVGLFWGDSKGGEPQISRGTREVFETLFPFVKEWTEVAGLAPNDGMRAGDLGYRLDDGVSARERALGAFAGLGKAFGIRGTTPHDALSPALDASRSLDEIERRAIGEGRLPMEGPQGAPRENMMRKPSPGVYTSVEEAAYWSNQAPEQGNVVIDGDTLKLEMPDGTYETVRLLGINTPERGELGANAAAQFLERLLAEGGEIQMVRDKVDKDPYGRLLRYVWVGDKMLNLQLVEAGLAQPQPYYPNRAFESLLNG